MASKSNICEVVTPTDSQLTSIATLISSGIPVVRAAEILDIPYFRLQSWIDAATRGDKRFAQLKKLILEATISNESNLLKALNSLAVGGQTQKTTRTTYNSAGELEKSEVLETTTRPSFQAIQFLLKMQSSYYKETTESSTTQININNGIQTIVQLPDNGRPIEGKSH